jgi:GxxExxY protein
VVVPEMMQKHDLPEHIERLAREIIGCAIEVHRGIGPGLLESLYETAMVYELEQRSIPFCRTRPLNFMANGSICWYRKLSSSN